MVRQYRILMFVIMVVVAATLLTAYLLKPSSVNKVIEEGDCILINYTMRYASNGTIIETTYKDVAIAEGIYDNNHSYEPKKVFVNADRSKVPPPGFCHKILPAGLIEKLVGLAEGEKRTITLSPKEAYGVKPKEGDTILFPPLLGKDLRLKILDIRYNESMPTAYISLYGNKTTTVYVIRKENLQEGDSITLYSCWPNGSTIVKINETTAWIYTTPLPDKMKNLTWVEKDRTTGKIYVYWENSTDVINISNETITLYHHPTINSTMTIYDTKNLKVDTYRVIDVSPDKIRMVNESNHTLEIDRIKILNRTTTISIIEEMPEEALSQLLELARLANPYFEYSLDKLSDETIVYEVEIVKIYKQCKNIQ